MWITSPGRRELCGIGDPRGKNAEIDVDSEGATKVEPTLVLVGRLVNTLPVVDGLGMSELNSCKTGVAGGACNP